MIHYLIPLFLSLIVGIPVFLSAAPLIVVHSVLFRLIFLGLSPFIFILCYLFTAGILSKPFHKAIIPGKFPRKLDHQVYGPRRMFGLCWTSIYYFTPLYYLFLTVPLLKKIMFRIFGYKGEMDFTIYPDTWLRDLPLLSFGPGAYLSNRATIGTNVCLSDGNILVDKIRVKKGGIVGHLSMIGPGVYIGESAEVGVGVAMGIRARVQANSKIGPASAINHGVDIGTNAEVGSMSYLGVKTVIGDNIKLPGGSNIPSGAIIKTQEDLEKFISSETNTLNELREKIGALYAARESTGLRTINLMYEDKQTGS